MNFKKTLSLVLAVLMVMAVVPFGVFAADCGGAHVYTEVVYSGDGFHYYKCECGKANIATAEDCSGDKADAKCGEYKKCEVCDGEYELVAHIYEEETIDEKFLASSGSCKEVKKYYKNCINEGCDAFGTDTFDSTETGAHNWNAGTSNNNATCVEDGTKVVTCLDCGKTETITDEGSAKGHNFVEGPKDEEHFYLAPTCTKGALYFQMCSVCGFNAKDLGEDANRPVFEVGGPVHDFIVPEAPIKDTFRSAATCTSSATFYKVCSKCTISAEGIDEEAFYEDGPFAEHKLVDDAQKKYLVSPATCTERAIYAKSCSACGVAAVVNTNGEDITTPGFDTTDTQLEVYVDGELTEEEINKGIKANAFRYGDPLNHGKTTITKEAKEPTCTADGNTEEVTCDYCDVVLTESKKIDKLGHELAAKPSQEYVAPTCKQYGTIGKIDCVRCNTTFAINEKNEVMTTENLKTFQIEPLGHADENGDLVCDRCAAILEASDLCNCIACNGTGLMFFIGWLLKWVWSMMGTNQYCECGLAHY